MTEHTRSAEDIFDSQNNRAANQPVFSPAVTTSGCVVRVVRVFAGENVEKKSLMRKTSSHMV